MTRPASPSALKVACVLLLLKAGGIAHSHSPHPRPTRATSHSVRTGTYDKCSHPFHAWMCQPPSRPRSFPVTTPTPSRGNQLTATDALPFQDSRPAPTPSTTPPSPRRGQAFSPEAAPSRISPPNTLVFSTLVPPLTTPPAPRRGSILFSESAPPPPPPPPPPSRPPQLPSTTPEPDRSFLSSIVQPKTLHQEPVHDQCSHPFHSWLCNSPRRPLPAQLLQVEPQNTARPKAGPRPTSRPLPRPTPRSTPQPTPRPSPRSTPQPTPRPSPRSTPQPTPRPTPRSTLQPTPRPAAGPIPEASNSRKDSLLLPQTTRPSPATTTKPRPYNLCLHPFHSWRCEEPKLDSKASNLGKAIAPALPKPSPRPTIQPLHAPAPLSPKPTWDGADSCSHAFHSWLCGRSHPRPTQRPAAAPVFNPDASFSAAAPAFAPNNFITTLKPPQVQPTTKAPRKGIFLLGKPSTPKAPEESNEPEPQPKPEPSPQDTCRHPFHSFLCTSSRQSTAPSPVEEPVAAPAFLLSPAKVRPHSERDGLPAHRPSHNPQCDHPFHAWLCDRLENKPKKHLIRSNGTQRSHNKILNTVTASSQAGPHSPTVPPRPVPTVPTRPPVRRRQAQAAPSTAPLAVSALALPGVFPPPHASLPIDLVNTPFDLLPSSHSTAQSPPPATEAQ